MMDTQQLKVTPIMYLPLPENGEAWLSKDQVAAFFHVSVRDIPHLIKDGLAPPVTITHKNRRFPLKAVLEYNEKLKSSLLVAQKD